MHIITAERRTCSLCGRDMTTMFNELDECLPWIVSVYCITKSTFKRCMKYANFFLLLFELFVKWL